MSDIGERAKIFLAERTDVLIIPTHFALSRLRQTAEDAQQAGLAAAVSSSYFDQFTAVCREVQILEKAAITSNAPKTYDFQHYQFSTSEAIRISKTRQANWIGS